MQEHIQRCIARKTHKGYDKHRHYPVATVSTRTLHLVIQVARPWPLSGRRFAHTMKVGLPGTIQAHGTNALSDCQPADMIRHARLLPKQHLAIMQHTSLIIHGSSTSPHVNNVVN